MGTDLYITETKSYSRFSREFDVVSLKTNMCHVHEESDILLLLSYCYSY